jgi:hypothetical protein
MKRQEIILLKNRYVSISLKETVDRGRIPAGRRNHDWTHSLPEKAEGFTKRPSAALRFILCHCDV